MPNHLPLRTKICCDCGAPFITRGTRSVRCPVCQKQHISDLSSDCYHRKRRLDPLPAKTKLRFIGMIPGLDTQTAEDCMDFVGRSDWSGTFQYTLKSGYFPSGLVVEVRGKRKVVMGTRLAEYSGEIHERA